MQDVIGHAVSSEIIDRYNDIHRRIFNRPDLKPISKKLDNAMDDFRKAVQAAEDALAQAEQHLAD